MKKISLVAMAAALVFGATALTGCVQGYPKDEEIIDLSQFYLVGEVSAAGWAFTEDNNFTKNDDGNYELEFVAAGGTSCAIAESSWTTQFRTLPGANTPASITVGDENVKLDCLDPGFGNNMSMKGLTEGKTYKMVITTEAALVKVISLECNEPELMPKAVADVDSLTVATVTQENAYIKLEGDSTGKLGGTKFFFTANAAGTEAVSTVIVEIAEADFSAWSTDHFAAWFKFYAGDNSTAKVSSKQFKATKTTLGVAGSIAAGGDGYNNIEVTDLKTAGIYKFVITVTATGVTYKVTKL